jgi:hypothetical protein
MTQQSFAQKRAEESLNRRGLRTNVTGEIEPIPKDDSATDNVADDATDTQAAANTPAATTPPATDAKDYKAEFERLQADFQALQGRVAPTQRDADTFKGLYETSSRELQAARDAKDAELSELRQQLQEATTARERKSIEDEIDELISDEDKAAIDPSVLALVRKTMSKFAARPAPAAVDHDAIVARALADRDKKIVDAHRSKMLADANTELGKLKALSQDPEFNAYCEENPEVDMTLTHFLHASTTADIDRYARAANRLISAYRTGKTPAADTRAADPKSAGGSVLQSALARTAAVKMSEEQVRQKTNEFKQLIRNKNPESKAKAALLMAEIEANT